jgi:hypothetical protein
MMMMMMMMMKWIVGDPGIVNIILENYGKQTEGYLLRFFKFGITP